MVGIVLHCREREERVLWRGQENIQGMNKPPAVLADTLCVSNAVCPHPLSHTQPHSLHSMSVMVICRVRRLQQIYSRETCWEAWANILYPSPRNTGAHTLL